MFSKDQIRYMRIYLRCIRKLIFGRCHVHQTLRDVRGLKCILRKSRNSVSEFLKLATPSRNFQGRGATGNSEAADRVLGKTKTTG